MISQKTKRRVKRITGSFLALIFSALLCVGLLPERAYAEGGILDDSNWQLLFETDYTGVVQSVCVTDYYIITLENKSEDPSVNDLVSAYYRYDYDENGNPVQQYSLAKFNDSTEWEHGNGMCYNPNTNEIYVALYTNTIPENRGCVYVMDPDTLQKKGSIKIADNYNILAIAYNNFTDQYIIQTNADEGYSVKILDSSFNLYANLGPEDPSPGTNFQDFTLVGDYLLQFPLTWNMGIGEYMMAYQVSSASIVDLISLHFEGVTDYHSIEPESVAMIDGAGFIIPVNVYHTNGEKKCMFYRAEFPYLELSAKNNQVSETDTLSMVTTEEVERGQEEVSVSKTETQLTDHEVDMTPKESHAGRIILIILIIIFLGGAAAFLLYVRHVHIEREKREARMRKARRIVIANMSMEEDEPFDIDNLDI